MKGNLDQEIPARSGRLNTVAMYDNEVYDAANELLSEEGLAIEPLASAGGSSSDPVDMMIVRDKPDAEVIQFPDK